MKLVFAVCLVVFGCGDDDARVVDASIDAMPEVTFAGLVGELADLDALSRFADPPYQTLQASSWDRNSTTPDDPTQEGWYANIDRGEFQDTTGRGDNREYILVEQDGPGAIVRIWSAGPMGTLRIYLDDFDEPAIEASMEQIMDGTHPLFPDPFAYVAARGFNLYFPIPYARRVRITTDEGNVDPKLYYHVNLRHFADDVVVERWSPAVHEAAAAEIADAAARLAEPFDSSAEALNLPAIIEATPGGSVIRKLTIRTGADADALREAMLVMRFDGQETVRAPLGDFFGTGPGANELDTLAFRVTAEGTFTCRLPMPFAERAEIAVEGLDVEAEAVIEARVFDEDTMHFHAGWRSTGVVDSQPKRDLDLVELIGRGTYVGTHLVFVNPINDWWGEGDEKIYVDGETFPTWFGTGTEDYFGYAHADLSLFSRPYHAQTRTGGTTHVGHISNLRVHVVDAIPFERSLDFDLEIWAWVPSEVALDWVVYWYAQGGTDDLVDRGPSRVIDPATLR